MLDEAVTAIGTPNIALIKYWGKRDEKLILPQNSSVSITLDEKANTKTSVLLSKKFKKDNFYIDGKLQDLGNPDVRERFVIIDKLRELAKTKARVLVVSHNSFPASSGMASSASGIATLTYAASTAMGLNLTAKQLSIIARMGSGSACRSVFGGFVKWNVGTASDGSDSYAEQVAKRTHWPEIIDLIAVVSTAKKKVPSRAGMKQTVANSVLYRSRKEYVEGAVATMVKAIKSRDFETLAVLTMRDSNNMHATMLDTWPPIFYMNDMSRRIVEVVEELNIEEGKIVAAYTFDAGPNAHIITLRRHRNKVVKALIGEGITDIIQAGIGRGPRLVNDSIIDTIKA
jgi:diphosphomevalonate decarboxylase